MRRDGRSEVGRDVLGLDRANVVQTDAPRPRGERRHVPLVLRHRVRRAAVGEKLSLKACEGGGKAHGLELDWVPLGRRSP